MKLSKVLRTLIVARQQVRLPVRLSRHQIYILPTRAGLVLAGLVLAMLVAAINYTNNLAFLLTFLLGSVSVVSAIHAYANLVGLEVEQARQWPAYSGRKARVRLVLQAAGRERRMVRVCVGQTAKVVCLEALERHDVDVDVLTTTRGLVPLERVVLSTRYPLGLFRAWSPLILPVQGLVYPRPETVNLDWTPWPGSGENGGTGGVSPVGEFSGLRPYRPEDGLTRVAWKASARGTGLYAKEYRDALSRFCLFDWQELGFLGYEERISRLAGLVREAQRRGLSYGLRIPGVVIHPGSGPTQAHRCLKALALLPETQA